MTRQTRAFQVRKKCLLFVWSVSSCNHSERKLVSKVLWYNLTFTSEFSKVRSFTFTKRQNALRKWAWRDVNLGAYFYFSHSQSCNCTQQILPRLFTCLSILGSIMRNPSFEITEELRLITSGSFTSKDADTRNVQL